MYQQTRQALTEFMTVSGKSQRQVSKETGLSTSVISQFLNATYTGDNAEVARVIEQYLTIGKERLNTVSTSCFYPDLHNTRAVLFTCNYAHRHNDVTLVSGDAGAGKTTALKYYADNNAGVIFVTANACTTSATAILSMICDSIGKHVLGRKAALMNAIVDQLAGSNRLIIIDEADHLSFDALQAIRNINDLANVGIVLAGNDKIYRQMLSGKRSYEFDQLRTRIIVRKRVINDYTVDEMKAVFPGVDQDCLRFLHKLACSESLRTAKKLFDVAAEFAVAKSQAIGIKHLQDIQRQLFEEVSA